MSREADKADDVLAPHQVPALFGQERAEQTLLAAYRSGRLHHALMLSGPPGIGKATLAYRFAKFLFEHPDPGAADAVAATSLAVAPDSRPARLVSRLAHPDLVVLSAAMFADENRSGDIKVDHVRWAQRKLATASDSGGWRVCIVDPADDLNRSAANALLKVLEEPGARTIFILVANYPGRLLATIRSRCLKIELARLSDEDVTRAVTQSAPGTVAASDMDDLVSLAMGSPGAALTLAAGGGLELHEKLGALTGALPDVDLIKVHEIADQLARQNAGERFELFMELLINWLAASMRERALGRDDGGPLEPWLELWDKVTRAFEETRALNLDRKQLILTTFFELEAAARASARG